MAPSEVENPVSRREAWKTLPDPVLYPVKEAKFEKYIEPQSDGYERAKAQSSGNPAIVIDNGELVSKGLAPFHNTRRSQSSLVDVGY